SPCRSCTWACPTPSSTTPVARTCWPRRAWIPPASAPRCSNAGRTWPGPRCSRRVPSPAEPGQPPTGVGVPGRAWPARPPLEQHAAPPPGGSDTGRPGAVSRRARGTYLVGEPDATAPTMTIFRTALPAGLALSSFLLPAPRPAAAAESFDNCSGFIDSVPAVIATQGVWCLRGNLATNIGSGGSSAITIAANNVTIDCNHFKLGGLAAGNGSQADGIHASDRQ